MRTVFAVVATLALLAGGAGAGETRRLSGTMSHGEVPDGVPAYLKLVGGGETCMDPGAGRYAGQAAFSGGEARYVLEDVEAGRYTACFFIDTDDNVMETQGPTSGDYGAMKAVTVEGDTSLDVAESEWARIP